MRTITILVILLSALGCIGAPLSDCRMYVQSSCLLGEWKEVNETPVSGYPGLYLKDTVYWRIGLDSVTYQDPQFQVLHEKQSIIKTYPRGGAEYGVMWQRRGTDMRDRVWEGDASWLLRSLRLGLPGAGRLSQATFSRISQDTLLANFDGRRVTLIK